MTYQLPLFLLALLSKLALIYMIRRCGSDLNCLNTLWQPIAQTVMLWTVIIALSRWFWPTIYTRPQYVRFHDMTPWDRDGQRTKSELTPESFRVENPYMMFSPPLWQVSIWAQTEKAMVLIGHASRLHNHLVANWHVLNTAPLDTLYILVQRPGKEIHRVKADLLKWVTLVDDIACASLDEAKITLPGVVNAKVAHVEVKVAAQIATDFPTANASTGLLENHPEVWGMLRFNGSTRPGFSGATYFAGKQMYGVHSFGGVENQGYSASYLALLIKKAESSDYLALRNMLDRSDDHDYLSRRVNPDEYEVRYQGRYFVIEAEEYVDLSDDYPLEDFESGRRRVSRRNYRSRSVETDLTSERGYRDVEFENAIIPSKQTQEIGIQCEIEEEENLRDYAEKLVREAQWDWRPQYNPIEPRDQYTHESWPVEPEDLLVFEGADLPEPIVPSGNECSPSQEGLPILLGGESYDETLDISSPRFDQLKAHSLLNHFLDPTTTGQQQQLMQSFEALSSTLSTLVERMTNLESQQRMNSSGSERSTQSATQSSTRPTSHSSPKKKRTGGRSSKQSTGPPHQGLGHSKDMPPTKTYWRGMDSKSKTKPTTRASNSWSRKDSNHWPTPQEMKMAATVAVVGPVPRT